MKNGTHRPLRVGLISLGCAKNLVDAEIMLGALEEMLNQVAEFHEDELDRSLTRITTWVEPVLLLVMGGLVAVVVMIWFPGGLWGALSKKFDLHLFPVRRWLRSGK